MDASVLKTAGRCLVAVCLALGFAPAGADDVVARLSKIEGTALVDAGAGFQPAHEGMMLKAGDRVLAKETGSADVVFDTGCHHTVRDNEVFAVTRRYCEMVYAKGPAVGASAPSTAPPAAPLAPVVDAKANWWIPAALIGGTLLAIAADDDDGSRDPRPTISPP